MWRIILNGGIIESDRFNKIRYGGLAQLVRALASHARGSWFKPNIPYHFLWGYSAVGSASASHVEGRGFDSPYLHHFYLLLLNFLYLTFFALYYYLSTACAILTSCSLLKASRYFWRSIKVHSSKSFVSLLVFI